MKLWIRGCPGQGTTWLAKVVTCLFTFPVTVTDDRKHQGCHISSNTDTNLANEILEPTCLSHNCTYVVIARHPSEFKHGRPEAYKVWEAYYGAWMMSNVKNVRYLRYEDAVTRLCTAKHADPDIVYDYYSRINHTLKPLNKNVWRFWNYTIPRKTFY